MRAFTQPKDNERFRWTAHVVRKMTHYRLTPARVMRIVRAPERTETGVAPGTFAGMQRTGTKEKPTELWAMWRTERKKGNARVPESDSVDSRFALSASLLSRERLVIITAWRYPGVSPIRDEIPIPSDVMAELEAEGLLDDPLD
jgi:hypothetical protein